MGGTALSAAAFTITNWNSSSPSPGYMRIGMPFKRGDVPSGSTLQLKGPNGVVAAQFDQRSYYPQDGSLMYCVCAFRDVTFNPSEVRTYTPYVVANSSWNNAGSLSLSDLTSNHQFQVLFSNVGYVNTVWPGGGKAVNAGTIIIGPNTSTSLKGVATIQSAPSGGTTGSGQPTWNTTVGSVTTDGTVTWTNINASSNTNTYGSGGFTIDFNYLLTHTTSNVATRVTKIHSGPVCETWMAWGMASDNSSNTADAHLKGYVYVTMWKDAGGSVVDYEFGCVVSQDWWSIANKYCLTYNASLIDLKNSKTYLTYNNIVHPYNSQWFTGRNSGNDADGRRFWVNQTPTLGYQPSKSYWVSTDIVPPFNVTPSITFGTSPYTSTMYTPCVNINTNAQIDQTGGSNGRGVFMDSDVRAFLSQAQADVTAARRSALGGLGVPYHFRSNDTRTRPQDKGVSDTGSCPMSLNLAPQPSSSYTFTSQGMPAPVDAYYGSGTSPTYADGYVAPLGGTGVWTPSINCSHASTYCYFIYLLEGERHFLECSMDLAENAVQQQVCQGIFGGVCKLPFYNWANYQTAFNIPSTAWHGVSSVFVPGNTRSAGWALTLLTIAAAITPSQDALGNVESTESYFNALLQQSTMYMATAVNSPYMPSSQLSAGWWIDSGNGSAQSIASPWMQDFIVMGSAFAYLAVGDMSAQTMVNFLAKHTIGLVNTAIYRTVPEKILVLPTSSGVWTSGTNEFFPIADCPADLGLANVTVAGGSSANITVAAGIGLLNPLAIAANDTIYWSSLAENLSSASVPAEVSIGTAYYVVSTTSSGSNQIIQISATRGGSPITFALPYSGCQLFWYGTALLGYAVATSSIFLPQSDSYPAIARAALAFAKRAGVSGASASLATMQTFLTTTDANLEGNVGNQYLGWFMNA